MPYEVIVLETDDVRRARANRVAADRRAASQSMEPKRPDEYERLSKAASLGGKFTPIFRRHGTSTAAGKTVPLEKFLDSVRG